jgi:hypothetical protein
MNLFRAFIDRIKLLFATAAASELEADFLSRDAERRADLLRQASRYEGEGLPSIAARLRDQAEATAADRPAGSVLPALGHWQGESNTPALPLHVTHRLPTATANGHGRSKK